MRSTSGTFLLRFSDSELGGITIAWVAEDPKGDNYLQDFIKTALLFICQVDENIPRELQCKVIAIISKPVCLGVANMDK